MNRPAIYSRMFSIELLAAVLGAAWAVTLVMRGSHDEAESLATPAPPPISVCTEPSEPSQTPVDAAAPLPPRWGVAERNPDQLTAARTAAATGNECSAE